MTRLDRLRIVQTEAKTKVSTQTREGERRFGNPETVNAEMVEVTQVVSTAMSKYDVEVEELRWETDGYVMVVETPKPTLSLFMQYVNGQIACRINRMQGRKTNMWHPRFKSVVLQPGLPEEEAIEAMYEGLEGAKPLGRAIDLATKSARFYASAGWWSSTGTAASGR